VNGKSRIAACCQRFNAKRSERRTRKVVVDSFAGRRCIWSGFSLEKEKTTKAKTAKPLNQTRAGVLAEYSGPWRIH